MLRKREDMEVRLAKIRAKEKAQRDRYLKGDHNVKKRKTNVDPAERDDDEEQFVLDDYDSDEEQRGAKDEGSLYSAKTLELMEKLGMGASVLKEDEEEVEEETKVSSSIPSLAESLTFNRSFSVLVPTPNSPSSSTSFAV